MQATDTLMNHQHQSLWPGLRACASAAVNVTAQLIAWNATQAPVVSHNSVYTIAPLGSKQFLSFDLTDTLAEAGFKSSDMSKFFMHLTVSPSLIALNYSHAGKLVVARCRSWPQPMVRHCKKRWGLAWALRCHSQLMIPGDCEDHSHCTQTQPGRHVDRDSW